MMNNILFISDWLDKSIKLSALYNVGFFGAVVLARQFGVSVLVRSHGSQHDSSVCLEKHSESHLSCAPGLLE
jgi:hypothetical protein